MKNKIRIWPGLLVVKLYQLLLNFKHTLLIAVFGYTSYCKHQPSCSQYTLYQVKKNGTIRGLYRGLKRVLTCW